MQMKDRTNTADDYILRAGVMYSLARYYRKRGKTQFANQCLSLHSFCLNKLKKYHVKFVEHPNGVIEFYENKHQHLYVGKRPEWANR